MGPHWYRLSHVASGVNEQTMPWPLPEVLVSGLLFQLLEGEEDPQTPKPKNELPSHFSVRPVSLMDKHIEVRKTLFTPLSERKVSPTADFSQPSSQR